MYRWHHGSLDIAAPAARECGAGNVADARRPTTFDVRGLPP
ncbi:hypothetical protein D187_002299 [Cystobacter fuscus DSM 2262]|uniref:Uncharacterized protein n=1 Tax=Cystobacter fuscus (strain ATCC 25194 / DSM 2262 / NBRC 100088 / M29) TaxID=1242864 RepID=S9QUA1_CYSF2|nr:hypothetical protein D187_002299 [Cystobacter fuscus DSM 2262]